MKILFLIARPLQSRDGKCVDGGGGWRWFSQETTCKGTTGSLWTEAVGRGGGSKRRMHRIWLMISHSEPASRRTEFKFNVVSRPQRQDGLLETGEPRTATISTFYTAPELWRQSIVLVREAVHQQHFPCILLRALTYDLSTPKALLQDFLRQWSNISRVGYCNIFIGLPADQIARLQRVGNK